jgi:hypothetical protein
VAAQHQRRERETRPVEMVGLEALPVPQEPQVARPVVVVVAAASP